MKPATPDGVAGDRRRAGRVCGLEGFGRARIACGCARRTTAFEINNFKGFGILALILSVKPWSHHDSRGARSGKNHDLGAIDDSWVGIADLVPEAAVGRVGSAERSHPNESWIAANFHGTLLDGGHRCGYATTR